MVAQMTLDHFVWVRVLVPEPFFYGAMVNSATKWQIIKHKIKSSKADALELSLVL